MIDLKQNSIISIDNSLILCNYSLDKIKQNIIENSYIVCFEENFLKTNNNLELLNNNFVKSMIVVSPKYEKLKNDKLLYYSRIPKKLYTSLTNNIFIFINLTDNYEYLKSTINNLKILLHPTLLQEKPNITFCISNNNSTYFDEFINCIKAIYKTKKSEQYEYIYDTVCDFLDTKFIENNYCDFKNDRCIASRSGCCKHETMGCCYSFKYAKFYELRLVKDVKLCQYMQNRTCATKNITCKLFTCKYLKKNNIKFDIHKMLLLDCFFNKKQLEIITTNFFKSREQILEKLQEENHDLFFWYYIFRKYMIEK